MTPARSPQPIFSEAFQASYFTLLDCIVALVFLPQGKAAERALLEFPLCLFVNWSISWHSVVERRNAGRAVHKPSFLRSLPLESRAPGSLRAQYGSGLSFGTPKTRLVLLALNGCEINTLQSRSCLHPSQPQYTSDCFSDSWKTPNRGQAHIYIFFSGREIARAACELNLDDAKEREGLAVCLCSPDWKCPPIIATTTGYD